MLSEIKKIYHQYREYIRIDLVMYGVLILLIVVYFVVSLLFS